VKVNCAAIPGALLEASYLDMKRGVHGSSFLETRPRGISGRGTLFLDGIDEIEMSLQAKLLQLLQDGNSAELAARRSPRSAASHLRDEQTPAIGNCEWPVSPGCL